MTRERYLRQEEMESVRIYFELAIKQIASMWRVGLPPLEARVKVADDAIDFYIEVLGETVAGALHCSIEDGNLERFESVEGDVQMELERPVGERDEAGLALGQLLIVGGAELTDALHVLWNERIQRG